MLYLTRPKGLVSTFTTVGCFLRHGDEFLLLRRHPHKPYGGLWGLPAGKVEAGETHEHAVIRETLEESGIVLNQGNLEYVQKTYVDYGNSYMYEFYFYHYPISEKSEIRIDPTSHTEYAWITVEDALLKDNLVEDFDTCIHLFDSYIQERYAGIS